MANNNFDKHIKDQLSKMKEEYDSSSWDSMNSRLDEVFGAEETSKLDNEFDQNIYEKLDGHQLEFQSADWEKLSEKLDEEKSVRRRIINIALLQFVVVFLVFLSLWNWKGAEIVHEHKERQAEKSALQFAFAQQQENFYNQFLLDLESKRSLSTKKTPLLGIDMIISKARLSAAKTISIDDIEQSTLNLLRSARDFDRQSMILAVDASVPETEGQFVLASDKKSEINTYQEIDKLSPLAKLDQELDYDNALDLNRPKSMLLHLEKDKNKLILSLGAAFSPDLYVIRSPTDPVYHHSGHYSDSFGLSGGVTFSARRKSLELESGILYSSVSYKPREVIEPFQSNGRAYETSLEDILFNVVSVPMQLKKHINIGKNSSFYTVAGASFHAIINSNFDIHLEQIDVLEPLTEGSFNNKPELDKKDFDPGIFEGGSLFDNAFATADLGIGFEQLVANKFSFYVQPTLHTQWTNGIGPNKDKLHKLSVYLGAKYHFNRPVTKI